MINSSKLTEICLKEIDVNAFWERVNSLIKAKKITQEDVACKIGTGYPAFRGWSHRKYFPNANQVYAIAQILDTTVDYLLFGEDESLNKKTLRIGETVLSLIKLINEASCEYT